MAASPAVLSLILFVILISSMPSAPHASSPRLRAASENLPPVSSSVDEEVSNRQSGRTEAGWRALAGIVMGVSESARQVPTGSNPLHHNHDPITKPKQDVHTGIASHP
ncbi:hypothetical protein MLD38_003398 [Melastoma candidum]|uniref:Uncharacterized protein n=1 Tax=Melastoma candidum TaxID=119954 RepID=A0ACB9S2B4_9MYRT|nr:hypothetical protein MLD38_003398 [Melastoma candidum]